MGAAAARGDYLLFIDADAVIPEIDEFFATARAAFTARPDLVALTVKYRVHPQMASLFARSERVQTPRAGHGDRRRGPAPFACGELPRHQRTERPSHAAHSPQRFIPVPCRFGRSRSRVRHGPAPLRRARSSVGLLVSGPTRLHQGETRLGSTIDLNPGLQIADACSDFALRKLEIT